MPKGLRSFDSRDADYFLELLSGPRDRDGLPDCLRFWKTRIEETDPDETFAVGLIYGPSGCGKSSLVKAGLLPRLSGDVLAVYVEATADETERRLLNGLRKRWSGSPPNFGLTETLAAFRRGQGAPAGKKILVVLDQFEQWLHAKKDEQDTALVHALRQCDGGRVQCVVMVRDDFWLAVSRFLRDLEVRLVEGHNSALADLFDRDHARKVLAAFGRAFGKLPESGSELSNDQRQFLEQAVSGLAQDGKIVCVRLALFADMMKGKPWTPASLKEVGGMEGVGVAFLEETFSAAGAPPQHRYHQKAGRAVLRSLLPESGTDIKGHMRSRDELLEASGYVARPRDFDDLLGILDGEIRLISPTDPEGKEAADESATQSLPGQKYYQLTHDYLVPSLREWLTRKQRETRRGRAEMRLAGLAVQWNDFPAKRQLPSLWEWVSIQLFARQSNWTDPQRRMMRASFRYHGARWGSVLILLLALGLSVQSFVRHQQRENDQRRATSLADVLFTAPPDAVPFAIENIKPLRTLAVPILNERFADETKPHSQRLHAAFGLAAFGQVETDFLAEGVATATDGECRNLLAAFSLSHDAALASLRRRIAATAHTKNAKTRTRLVIVMLHLGEAAPAIEACRIAEDPFPRRIFEETLPTWNAGIKELGEQVERAGDFPLRSAVCLAMGRIKPESLSDVERLTGSEFLFISYQLSPDTGTHGAADWAIRQWQLELPPLKDAAQPSDKRNWYVNSAGMTMLKLPAGPFRMGGEKVVDANPVDVMLTRDFHLADREVSVGQFQQFMDDPKTPASEKPGDWEGVFEDASPTRAHPVQQVNWYDAVLFCNWLSRREGRTPCYEWTGETADTWRRTLDADGYRLPTEAEWEYACRAGTMTDFSCGDDVEVVRRYAVFSASTAAACGSRLPNGWGFFDLHGNVWEWCQDWYRRELPGGRDPEVSKRASFRVLRGGSWGNVSGGCRSANRFWDSLGHRSNRLGFRVAADR